MERERPSDSDAARTSLPVRPLDWAQTSGKAETVARAIEDYARRRRRRRIAALSTCLALALLGGFAWRQRENPPRATLVAGASPATRPTAHVSQPEHRTLPDGSSVDLNAGADIAVQFGAGDTGPRRVVLVRGEAHFTVAKDAARPFVVEAGGVAVRAVGTAFSVQRDGAGVEVLVTEGRVAVDQAAPPPANGANVAGASMAMAAPSDAPAGGETAGEPRFTPLAFVDVGNRAIVTAAAATAAMPAAQVQPISTTEMAERLAWRVPRLEFNATPLAEVVAMFNRHAATDGSGARPRLVLVDAELEPLPLSGVLRADNLTVLLQIMESSYGIRVETGSGGETRLRKAQ